MAVLQTSALEAVRYELLASAVAGRPLRVDWAPVGERTYTDGRVVYLASDLDGEDRRSAVVVQSALLAAGSLSSPIVRRLIGRPRVAHRYLAVEGWRVLRSTGELLGIPVAARAHRLEVMSNSPSESLDMALGRRGVVAPHPTFGTIRPRLLLGAPKASSPEGSGEEVSEMRPCDTMTEEVGGETSESLFAGTSFFKSPLWKIFMRHFGLGAQRGGEPGSGDGDWSSFSVSRSNQPGRDGPVSLLASGLAPVEVFDGRTAGWRYPEWDDFRAVYRPGWCTVVELSVEQRGRESIDTPRSRDLEHRLARLGVGLIRERRRPQGDDLDLDAVVEALVDLRADATPSEDLYIQSQRHRRSLAVLLLVDVSGSVADGTSVAGTAHREQLQAAATLAQTLHHLGDPVALFGFRSHGRQSVELLRIKDFPEAFSGLTTERLGDLTPDGYTRLGAAIRHGTHLLESRAGTDRRLLVVLSDGFPYDTDYEGGYARADARHALSEARRQGIGCLCLALGASTRSAMLAEVFGTAAYAAAPSLDELVPSLGPLFRSALASADLQRKIASRQRRGVA